MADPTINPLPAEKLIGKRLDSWKEIASHLNRDVTTVQRWEKREGMPVHGHLHDKRGSVYAFPVELDEWTRSRQSLLANEKRNGEDVGKGAGALELPSVAPHTTPWKWILPLFVLAAAVVGCALFWLQSRDRLWRNPIARARFEAVTDWGGVEQAAAISRDGQFIAFLSDRDGQMDVWVTQVGSSQFHNLTHGGAPELVNPSVRTLSFSPDGSLVTYWVRRPGASHGVDIGIWAVPILGGEPQPYLEGAAEFNWSNDGQLLAYHTPGPGDPLFVSTGRQQSAGSPIFVAPAGLHAHFPTWSTDKKFIYFVQGSLPDKLDIWRLPASGGTPERITSHNSQVSYPILLNRRTLLYLATDPDGSGPWLYGMDVEHRIPHRLTTGLERYTSLAASGDNRRLAATVSVPRTSLWSLSIDPAHKTASAPAPITLITSSGFRPRLGPDFLLYVSASATSESIWKLANGVTTELWRGEDAQIIGGPALSADGRSIAFSARQNGRLCLYVMASDGANPRILTGSLDLRGDPAWEPEGHVLITAAVDHGAPRLFRAPLNGGPAVPFVAEQSSDPAWAPDGTFVLYSGPDIGTTFSVKAVKSDGSALVLAPLTLTRGARHLAFLPGGRNLVVLRGDLQHKNLWLVNLDTGTELQLTDLPADFDVRGFDISPDGREAVLERVQDRSEVELVDLSRH